MGSTTSHRRNKIDEKCRLWQTLDEAMFAIYGQELVEVPLGLLEPAMSGPIRKYKVSTVPTIAVVWAAVAESNPVLIGRSCLPPSTMAPNRRDEGFGEATSIN
jgi:hypothetical protein